jgi:hypothetical protein
VAADGGVFAFGPAAFEGSMAGRRLRAPVAAMVGGAGQGESLHPGTYAEPSDNGAFVTVQGGTVTEAGSALRQGASPERLGFTVGWSPFDGRASARLHNSSAVPLDLPGGLRATVRITRDGTPWRELVVSDPSVRTLAPGASVSAVGPGVAPPDGDGSYAYEGGTVVVVP